MTDKAARAAEAYRRGLMGPETSVRYEEAVRRGIVKDGYARARLDAKKSYTEAKPPVGAKRDASSTPLVNGALFGWADELGGRVDQAEVAVRNLGRRMTGQEIPYTSSDMYEASRDEFRGQERAYASRHPNEAVAQGLMGGLMTGGPVGAGTIKGAPTLLRATGRAAAVGAGYGAAAGAGSADGGLADRARGAATGAATGAVVGAAVPAGTRAVTALPGVARRAGSAMTETIDTVRRRGAPPTARAATPQATTRAEGYVREIARRAGTDADTVARNPAYVAGKPVTGAELIGRQGVSQMTALGRRPGQTGDALDAALTERASGAPERVLGELETAAGIDSATAADDFAAQAARLREQASPLYDEAYAVGAVDSPRLQVLVSRPSMRRALSRAMRIAEEEGREPAELGFRSVQRGAGSTQRDAAITASPDGVGGRFQVVGSKTVEDPNIADLSVQVENPSAHTWDYVKRGLDDIIETYRDKTTGKLVLDEEGRAILGTLKSMRKELTTLNPAYERALAAGGEPLQMEEAYRLAPRLMSPGVSERAFRQRFDAFTDAQRSALRQGAVNSLYESIRNGRMKLKEMSTPAFRTKLEQLVGPEQATRFLDNVRIEADMAKAGGRMAPGTNSPTGEILFAAQGQDEAMRGAGNLAMGAMRGNASQFLAGAGRLMTAPFRGAATPIDEMTRDEVGRILIDPEEVMRILQQQGPAAPGRLMISPYAVPGSSGYAGSSVNSQ